MKQYFTLIVREPNEPWFIEFGDYDRNVVVDEMNDNKDSSLYSNKAKYKIIKTNDDQNSINLAVKNINISEGF